jgi:hypothetical protein
MVININKIFAGYKPCQFSSTSILDMATGYMECMIKEATDIILHPGNFNRNGSFTLSGSWYLVTNMLKQYRDTPMWQQGQAKQVPDSTY